MSDYITLACPSCGSSLEITNDIDRFACLSCGNEHIVRRDGGIVSLSPVLDGLGEIKIGVDKTASELAIKRLKPEIASLNASLWLLIKNESTRKPGPFDNPMESLPFVTIYRALCDSSREGRLKFRSTSKLEEKADTFLNASISELEEAIIYLHRICKNDKWLELSKKFGNDMLLLKKEINSKTDQLLKHEENVNT